MKVYESEEARREAEGSSRFAGNIGVIEIDLSEEMISELEMREALERFGRAIIAHYKRKNERLIGVELHSIGITFIYKPEEERRD